MSHENLAHRFLQGPALGPQHQNAVDGVKRRLGKVPIGQDQPSRALPALGAAFADPMAVQRLSNPRVLPICGREAAIPTAKSEFARLTP